MSASRAGTEATGNDQQLFVREESELQALPLGTLLRHSYGYSILSETDKLNADSFLEDVSHVRAVVGPEAYEPGPMLTELEQLPESGRLVFYDDDVPDFLGRVEDCHRTKNTRGSVIFRAKAILPEYADRF